MMAPKGGYGRGGKKSKPTAPQNIEMVLEPGTIDIEGSMARNHVLQIGSSTAAAGPGTLLFSSGFNSGLTITPDYLNNNLRALLTGTDSVTGDNWDTTPQESDDFVFNRSGTAWNLGYNNLDQSVHTCFGTTKILELTQDPENSGNQVLHIQHGADTADSQTDGRIQGFWDTTRSVPYFKSGYWKQRMYLENFNWWPDTEYGATFDFNGLWEIFQWDENDIPDYPGYATTYMNVIYGISAPYTLSWRVKNRYRNISDVWADNWTHDNNSVPVPTNSWFTLEVFYCQGTADGRLWIRITPDGESPVVLFNISDSTEHPNQDALVSDLQMWKMYGSAWAYRAPANAGYPPGIYYDNFEYWECTQVEFDSWLAAGG